MDILDELLPDPRPTFSGSWGEANCVCGSNLVSGASLVSADNAETLRGYSGDLDQTDTASPPTDEAISTSCPIPISNEDLDATTGIAATKPSFGKEDEGPS